MKNSIWLQEYVKEVGGKREKSNQNKKIILIIIPMMLLLFVIAAMAGSGAADPQVQSGVLMLVGVFAFVMLFVIILISKGKKMDVAKPTREHVTALLRSDAEVDDFDQQMKAEPIMEEKIASETTVFLTKDYVGMRFMSSGNLQYRFMRRSDIASFHYRKTESVGANPLCASYFFDVKNKEKKVIFNGVAESNTKLTQLEELLKVAQPDVSVKKK